MDIPVIPNNLDEWNISRINDLVKYVGIESEIFDFKKEPNELEEHLCAMANTKGGYLVLGIEQISNSDGKKTIGFEKRGFPHGHEDSISNRITNSCLHIDPIPNVELKHVYEEDGEKFYTVIKIGNSSTKKPYFVKLTDQCFVRINDSKIRASRYVILNLFDDALEQRRNIERLRSSSHLLKQELTRTMDFIKALNPNNTNVSATIDTSFLKNAVLSTESFLTENNLLNNDSHYDTFHFVFHTLGVLNHLIEKFNSATEMKTRSEVQQMLTQGSYIYRADIEHTSKFLDKVILCADNYLLNNK